MKKMMNSLKEKAMNTYTKTVCVLADKRGEGFVDSAIAILISVVIGALLLAGLYALFGETVLPTLVQRIKEMFNYAG
nr:DUF6133 family protein [uncultured Blautia sp.]